MARYGIVSDKVFGVSAGTIRKIARTAGTDHALALRLWNSGWLEARILAGFIADPHRLTRRDAERWANRFDNWAVTDGLCIHCFRKTPYAHDLAVRWAGKKKEFVKRAGFTMMATLAVHDDGATDAVFTCYLALVRRHATDERNGVKKAVNWALRQIGKRNMRLHGRARNLAERLAVHSSPAARWVARDALRELRRPDVVRRIKRRGAGRSRKRSA